MSKNITNNCWNVLNITLLYSPDVYNIFLMIIADEGQVDANSEPSLFHPAHFLY